MDGVGLTVMGSTGTINRLYSLYSLYTHCTDGDGEYRDPDGRYHKVSGLQLQGRTLVSGL
jgi:hypothetical protein